MKYISTRGGCDPCSFSDVVIEGLAKDGGLFMPETVPVFSRNELNDMRNMDYPGLALKVMSKFIDDIPKDDLAGLINKTYTKEVFQTDDITPLVNLGNGFPYMLNLYNGPTDAFKDIALQFLGNLFEYILQKRDGYLNVLGATSGDTGSAAIHGVKGKNRIRIFIMKPKNGTSRYQADQMDTVIDDYVFNLNIDGVFDSCQDIMKALSGDVEFKEKYQIGAVNSTNGARIVAQIVYYFKASFAYQNEKGFGLDHKVNMAVPSGNYGNILAGDLARQMGAPIDKLILATNENQVLADYFNECIYEPWEKSQIKQTPSPSMDIGSASNIERKFFWMTGNDGIRTKELMELIKSNGSFGYNDLNSNERKYWLRDYIYAGTAEEKNVIDTIKHIYNNTGFIVDPHTATGFYVAMENEIKDCICLATANPVKFEEVIGSIEEMKKELPLLRRVEYQDMENKPRRVYDLPDDTQTVRDFIETHASVPPLRQ